MIRFLKDLIIIAVGAWVGMLAFHSTRDVWLAVVTAAGISHGLTCFGYARFIKPERKGNADATLGD